MKYGDKPLHPGLGIRPNLLGWLDQPRMNFEARSVVAAKKWQDAARKTFLGCLGEAPPRVPLKSKVIEKRKLKGYHRTTLLLDTAPGIKALCWLCLPEGASPENPVPAMIATPGHGIGALDLLAMDAKGKQRPEGEGYQKDYALQAVRLGYAALVVEPMGFGQRRDAGMMKGSGESGCHAGFVLATMLGTTLARLRINDLQRALDLLVTVPEVDSERIGLMGISGGGQMTLWTTAIEPRLKLAIVSGYLNTFRDSVMAMHHCICNFAPGLARELDMTDLAALIAPRPIPIESGDKDPIFPIKATRRAVRRVREIYSVFAARERVEVDLFEGEHQWSGRKFETFLREWL